MVSLSLMIILILLFIGLCLGSFVNALIWRLHKQEGLHGARTKQAIAERKKLSIVHGRSMCMHCGHELAAKDLIPVLSWLSLRGKCRYCHHPIDDTPLAELLLPALLLVSYSFWPYAGNGWDGVEVALFVLWSGVLTCFVALAIYDAKWYLLPDRIVVPLTVLALSMSALLAAAQDSWAVLTNALIGALVVSGVFLLLSLVSRGAWIGGGDIKIGIALGLLAGTPLMALLVIFLASLLGSVYMLPGILRGKQQLKSMLPFGPFLIMATVIVFLWGEKIFDVYMNLFLQ